MPKDSLKLAASPLRRLRLHMLITLKRKSVVLVRSATALLMVGFIGIAIAAAEPSRTTLGSRVQLFVGAVTGNAKEDTTLPRWNAAVCFSVVGLAPGRASAQLARLFEVASLVNVPRRDGPCQPNFIIVYTDLPSQLLSEWQARNNHIFGMSTRAQIARFIDLSKKRPVSVWYNIDIGRVAGMRNGHFVASNTRADGSPFVSSQSASFSSVFAIVNVNRTAGVDDQQLADFVAMAGFTAVDLEADLDDISTILRLFISDGAALPGLSEWGIASLKTLYNSDQSSRSQRREIAGQMARQVGKAN